MKADPFRSIIDRIAQTRRRIVAGVVLTALGRATICVLLLALVFSLLIHFGDTDTWQGPAFYFACSVAAFWIIVRHLWMPIKQARSDRFVADAWEKSIPQLSDGLIACVEFSKQWGSDFKGSRPMVEQLATWVENEISLGDIRRVAPWTDCRRVWLHVIAVGVLLGAMLFFTPTVLTQGFAHLFLPSKTAEMSGITIQKQTLVGDITVTFAYPPYMKRPPKIIPNSTGRVKVPKGTRIDIEAVTMERQNGAFLMVDDREVPAQLTNQREVRATIVAERPADWRFGTVDERKGRILESTKRTIRLEMDNSPVVKLTTPKQDQELEDIRDVTVVYNVRDDIEIGRVAIGIALAGDIENAVRIEQTGIEGSRFEGADDIDLSVVDAEPGDRLALFVEAFDTNDVDGPQRGVSEVRFITIRSPSDKHLKLTESLNATIGRLLDRLADRLEYTTSQMPSKTSVVKRNSLHSDINSVIRDIVQIVSEMRADPLTPKQVSDALGTRVKALSDVVTVEGRYLSALSQSREPDKTDQTMANVILETENLIIYIEATVARLAMENLAQLAQELRASKDKLKTLINAYKERPNEALKGRILRNIRRLKDRMAALQQKLSKLRQKMPKEFLNIEGFKQDEVGKGLSKTRSQLEDIERLLDEGRVDEALNEIDEMSKALDELSASLDQDMQDLHDSSNPQQQKAISELMDQARDLMKQQDDIRQQTKKLDEAQQAARKEMLKKQLKGQLQELKNEVMRLRGDVDGLASHPWPSRSDEDLNTLNQRVQGLSDAVDDERLMGALERAEMLKKPLNRLQFASRFQQKIARAQRSVEDALKRDDKIIELLTDMLKQMRANQNNPNEGKQNEMLRQRQAGLSEAARRLQESMGEKSQQIPGLGGAASERLTQARDAMKRAGRELGRKQAGRARPGQREAVAQLKGLMQNLKNAAKPQRSKRGGERGRKRSQEKVKIPGADDHRAPDEFRKDLLDAMKDKAPERYQNEVKRYYEALVE